MIISFWSPKAGVAGNTTNLLLMAHILAERNIGKCLVFSPQYSETGPEGLISGSLLADEELLFEDRGIDSLLMKLKSGPISEELLKDCATELIENRLDILRSTKNPNLFSYDEEGGGMLARLPAMAAKYYDMVFVDAVAGNGNISKALLAVSDITVVNLRQSPKLIDGVIMASHLPENSFFLFGQYSEDSRYNMNNIRRKYRRINKRNSAFIPFDAAVSDAISEGRLYEYLAVMESADKGNGRFETFEKICLASELLLDHIKAHGSQGGKH